MMGRMRIRARIAGPSTGDFFGEDGDFSGSCQGAGSIRVRGADDNGYSNIKSGFSRIVLASLQIITQLLLLGVGVLCIPSSHRASWGAVETFLGARAKLPAADKWDTEPYEIHNAEQLSASWATLDRCLCPTKAPSLGNRSESPTVVAGIFDVMLRRFPKRA
jgi:hypothetical protein